MFVNSFQFCIIRFINTLIRQTHNPAWFKTKEDLSWILDLASVLQLVRGQGVSVLLSQGQPKYFCHRNVFVKMKYFSFPNLALATSAGSAK